MRDCHFAIDTTGRTLAKGTLERNVREVRSIIINLFFLFNKFGRPPGVALRFLETEMDEEEKKQTNDEEGGSRYEKNFSSFYR